VGMENYKKILIIFLFAILLIPPLVAFSQAGCRELEVPIPGLTTTCLPALPDYISAIYNFALMIIGIVCFGALLYGGFRYLTSAGKPTAMADAKDQIFSAILGLIILFSAYLILTTINPELVVLSQPGVQACGPDAPCPEGQECVAGICTVYPTPVEGSIPSYPSWSGGCSTYLTSDTCPTDKCEWCSVCSDTLINTWEGDRCVDSGTDCGYHCEVGKCGAETCEYE